jgi:hypothetical protein
VATTADCSAPSQSKKRVFPSIEKSIMFVFPPLDLIWTGPGVFFHPVEGKRIAGKE